MHKISNQLIYILQQNGTIYKISIYLNTVRNFNARWTEKKFKMARLGETYP